MKNFYKLKLTISTILMASSVAHSGFANASGNGSVYNPYLIGVIGVSPNVFVAAVTGNPNSSFKEFANFTIPTLPFVSDSANTYSINLESINVADINGLTMEV